MHPLLQLLILKLGRIEGGRVIHEGRIVEHGSVGVGIEVEAGAIVVLDGSVVHPGAHFCEIVRQPICRRKSATLNWNWASIDGREGQMEMTKRESRFTRWKSRWGCKAMDDTNASASAASTTMSSRRVSIYAITRHRDTRNRGGLGWNGGLT